MIHRDELPVVFLIRRLGVVEPTLRENFWWMRLWGRLTTVWERVRNGEN